MHSNTLPDISEAQTTPVSVLLCRFTETSEAMPDQLLGSGPCSLFLHRLHVRRLLNVPHDGGRVPTAETHSIRMVWLSKPVMCRLPLHGVITARVPLISSCKQWPMTGRTSVHPALK